jgi:hypothetical protein
MAKAVIEIEDDVHNGLIVTLKQMPPDCSTKATRIAADLVEMMRRAGKGEISAATSQEETEQPNGGA